MRTCQAKSHILFSCKAIKIDYFLFVIIDVLKIVQNRQVQLIELEPVNVSVDLIQITSHAD